MTKGVGLSKGEQRKKSIPKKLRRERMCAQSREPGGKSYEIKKKEM